VSGAGGEGHRERVLVSGSAGLDGSRLALRFVREVSAGLPGADRYVAFADPAGGSGATP
jgi:hypothetical protein